MVANTAQSEPTGAPREQLANAIRAIPSTSDFASAAERFANYPEPTLIGPTPRAFLHELVKACGARAVLEIGTYFAGTTRVLAEAATETGGVVISIDASGDRASTVEKIINLWSEETRAATTFVPHLSSMFFEMFERTGSFKFDMFLVDGDHSYRGALFDLISCAHYAQPNAVIVVDDFNLPPVFSATQDFLALNPAWIELSGTFDRQVGSDPFAGMRPSLEGFPFLVLIGPPAISIGRRPANFALGRLSQDHLYGAAVEIGGNHSGGRLHANFVIHSVTTEAMRSSAATGFAAIEESAEAAEVKLDPPLAPTFTDGATNNCDVSLVWESDTGGLLELAGEPELLAS